MSEVLENLFGEKPQTPVATPEATPPQPGQPRDDSGRFAAKTLEPPAIAAPVVEAPKPATEHGGLTGPALAAVLDEREKRQKAEARLAALEAQRQQPQQYVPSVQDDPEAFAAFMFEQTGRAHTSARFDISETLATEKHGAETVKAAMDWGLQRSQENPAFAAEYLRQKNPIDWAVRQHKKDKLISEMGDDDAAQKAFIERRARELGLLAPAPQAAPSVQAAPQPVAQPRPAAPSLSLASAPSAGGPMTPVATPNPVMTRLFG